MDIHVHCDISLRHEVDFMEILIEQKHRAYILLYLWRISTAFGVVICSLKHSNWIPHFVRDDLCLLLLDLLTEQVSVAFESHESYGVNHFIHHVTQSKVAFCIQTIIIINTHVQCIASIALLL